MHSHRETDILLTNRRVHTLFTGDAGKSSQTLAILRLPLDLIGQAEPLIFGSGRGVVRQQIDLRQPGLIYEAKDLAQVILSIRDAGNERHTKTNVHLAVVRGQTPESEERQDKLCEGELERAQMWATELLAARSS